jgi:zinc transporter ZupT
VQKNPAFLSVSVLFALLVAAWLGTLPSAMEHVATPLRTAIGLIAMPTAIGYALYFLRDAGIVPFELDTLGRHASWLVLAAASLIVLSQLGLIGGEIDLTVVGRGLVKLVLSVFAWASVLAFLFKRTRALRQRGNDLVVASIYFGVICIHNLPEGLTVGLSLSGDGATQTTDIGLLAALTLQNVVDAIIAGAVFLNRRISVVHKTGFLIALPVIELLSAVVGLSHVPAIGSFSDDALMFAAGGMLAIALTDIALRRASSTISITERA